MPDRRVTAHFEGPAVESGGVPFDDLLPVFSRLQSAVRHMVEDLAGRRPTRGRLPETIRSSGSLVLVGTHRGSFVAEIELAEPEAGVLPDFGIEALDHVISGMEHAAEQLPARVAREVEGIARSLREGIDLVRFDGGARDLQAVIRRPDRPALRQKSAPERAPRTVHGRILEVDWKDGTAELHTPSGVIRLAFDEEMAEELKRFARQHVATAGAAELGDDGQIRRLRVEEITSTVADDSFWRAHSVDDLIREQGVASYTFPPAGEAEEGEESAAEFLAAIFPERSLDTG